MPAVAIAVLALVATACSDEDSKEPATLPSQAPPPTSSVPEITEPTVPSQPARLLTVRARPGIQFAALMEGTIDITDTGCLALSGVPIIAPLGSEYDGYTLRMPDAPEFHVGDEVLWGGGYQTIDQKALEAVPGADQCADLSVEFAVVQDGDPASPHP